MFHKICDGRCNTDRSECIVCAKERRELSLPAAAGGLKTMGYGRMATHRPGGVLPGGHSPSICLRLEVLRVIHWASLLAESSLETCGTTPA
jgi:hypothetical protein